MTLFERRLNLLSKYVIEIEKKLLQYLFLSRQNFVFINFKPGKKIIISKYCLEFERDLHDIFLFHFGHRIQPLSLFVSARRLTKKMFAS